jgi:hypothetical protein
MVPVQQIVDDLHLDVVSAAGSTTRPVRRVHISELPDPRPYLRGDELLLLAGTNFQNYDSGQYVARLAEAGVAAIGLGLAPVLDTVPQSLIDACEEASMTLLAIPPSVPFESVVEYHYNEMHRQETQELKLLSEGQSVLIRAASGRRPFLTVTQRLAGLLKGWVLVVDQNRDRTWQAGPVEVDADVATALARAAKALGPMSASLATGEWHIEVHRLVGAAADGYAMAVANPRPFSVADRGIVAVASSALTLLFTDPDAAAGPGGVGAVAVAGAIGAHTLGARLAGALDVDDSVSWRVVRGVVRAHARPDSDLDDTQLVASVLATPLVDADNADGGEFVALIPDVYDVPGVTELMDGNGLVAGVSGPVPAAQLANALGQASTAFAAARLRGSSVVFGDASTGLITLFDETRAEAYADALLAPLSSPDAREQIDYPATLRAWLANHGNWDRTATALGVHRNTVRHRIKHAASCLDCDLNDPNVRMELWFALEWRARPS